MWQERFLGRLKVLAESWVSVFDYSTLSKKGIGKLANEDMAGTFAWLWPAAGG